MHCCLYCKGMTIGPMIRYLILYALEWKRMKIPFMYRNAYLSPRHHGRKKIPWLPFHPLPLPALLHSATTTTSTTSTTTAALQPILHIFRARWSPWASMVGLLLGCLVGLVAIRYVVVGYFESRDIPHSWLDYFLSGSPTF